MVHFFYDETFHDRKITEGAVDAKDFSSWFFAGIIGIDDGLYSSFEKDFLAFETRYQTFYGVEELKSQQIGKKKYLYGLASFKEEDLNLVSDLLALVSNAKLYLYFGVINKIEFLINQIFRDYRNNPLVDADNFRYSISKVIDLYRPAEVIHAIYEEDENFVRELRLFLRKKVKENVAPLKTLESSALSDALAILQESKPVASINWDYQISFVGFKKYIYEEGIDSYSLLIDREGSGHTLDAAKKEGIENCSEGDSCTNFGIRLADLLVGLLGRFVNSLSQNLAYSDGETQKKRLLPEAWFGIDELRFDLYRQLHQVYFGQRNAWYKYFASHYSDSLIYFLALLSYFDRFESYAAFKAISPRLHSEYVNGTAAQALQVHFEQMKNKLGIDFADPKKNKIFYRNQKGAKCFWDWRKQPYLPIKFLTDSSEKGNVFLVLSVGFLGKRERACVTIQTKQGSVCYALPDWYMEWADNTIGYASAYGSPFPLEIEFGNLNGRYYAEVL